MTDSSESEPPDPFDGIPRPMMIGPFDFFEDFDEDATLASRLASVMKWLHEGERRSVTVTKNWIFLQLPDGSRPEWVGPAQ